MGILDRNQLQLFPPFLATLCTQIRESELLENSMNINRLQLDLVGALVRYLAVLKISLLRSSDKEHAAEHLSTILSRFYAPTGSIWIQALERGGKKSFQNLFGKSGKGQKEREEICRILNGFLFHTIDSDGPMMKTLENFKAEFEKEDLKCSTHIEILEILTIYEELVSSQDLVRSRDRIDSANIYLSETISYLLNELAPLFEYKLGTLESYVTHEKTVLGFFRVHYGQSFFPTLLSLEERVRIGSVFLLKEGKRETYTEILELSPFLIQSECPESACSESGMSFYSSFHGNHAGYTNFQCGHDLKDKNFSQWLQNYWSKQEQMEFLTENEELYYRKLYSYWAMGIVDEKEEQALQIMHKVFNISIERLQVIEERVKKDLGISDDQESILSKNSYRELFEELTSGNILEALERVTLQEHARILGLRNTETWEVELRTWLSRARSLMDSQNHEDLEEILVQIALIDFQNPILKECMDSYGINTDEDPRIIERKKLFTEYLGYLNIVYTDQVVTPDERRFLEIQRKRLGITEKEAFELEFLEDNLVGVLEHEQDDTYLMQKENFKLGGILLAKALISDEQLNHALEVQNREKGTKLGGILYELGYIGPEDLKRCLDLQEHLYFRKDSYLIGAIALKFALIDQRQLKEGLRLQESIFREKRKHQQLGEILLSKGYISQQTLDFILSIQRLTAEN